MEFKSSASWNVYPLYSQVSPCGHLAIVDTLIIPTWAANSEGQKNKIQKFDWNKLPPTQTLPNEYARLRSLQCLLWGVDCNMLKLSYMLQLLAQSFYPSCYKYCQRWIKDIIIIRYLHHMLVYGFIQALKRVFCKFSSNIKTKWFKTTVTEPCFVTHYSISWN